MKKFFKIGLSLIIPIALVAQIVWWIYGLFDNLVRQFLPSTMEYHWWFAFIFILGLVILIILIGFIFSFISPLRWAKHKVEKYVIKKIPVIKNIYEFGEDISDSFLTDIKEDGDLQVIEVDMGGFKLLGVLTDEKNSLGFILSAPSPLTGVVLKLPNWRKLEMTFVDAVKINTSLGKVNGGQWK